MPEYGWLFPVSGSPDPSYPAQFRQATSSAWRNRQRQIQHRRSENNRAEVRRWGGGRGVCLGGWLGECLGGWLGVCLGGCLVRVRFRGFGASRFQDFEVRFQGFEVSRFPLRYLKPSRFQGWRIQINSRGLIITRKTRINWIKTNIIIWYHTCLLVTCKLIYR